MSEATAESLLAEAERLYKQGRTDYRDTLIEVGRLIHRFVLASLSEGDKFLPDKRRKLKIVRREFITQASRRLQTTVGGINKLLVAAMVVDLIGHGKTGTLSHGSIYQFCLFLYRVGARRDADHRRPVSLTETWAIKPQFAEIAPQLYAQAVAENWGRFRSQNEVRSRVGETPKSRGGPRPRPQLTPNVILKVDEVTHALSKAPADDVAEQCLKIVMASNDPAAVMQELTKATPPISNEVIQKVMGNGIAPKRRGPYKQLHLENSSASEPVPIKDQFAYLAKAAPGDIAEACMKIVLASEDPWQVAQRLIAELQKVPRKKPESLMFQRAAV